MIFSTSSTAVSQALMSHGERMSKGVELRDTVDWTARGREFGRAAREEIERAKLNVAGTTVQAQQNTGGYNYVRWKANPAYDPGGF
jgi:hypothetical protein